MSTTYLDHVALLVGSIEDAITALGLTVDVAAIEEFPGEGTRELYIGEAGTPARLLLMQPIGPGPYERAFVKRGPGLHHLAVRTPNLLEFSGEHCESGWLLHPRSAELLSTAGQLWLCRPGIHTLVEVIEGPPTYRGSPLITQISVFTEPGLEPVLDSLHVHGLGAAPAGRARLRIGDRAVPLTDAALEGRSASEPSTYSTNLEELEMRGRYSFDGREVAWGVVGSGPPLVAIHGTPWSSWNLRHLIQTLAREYRVYYFDLLGYGRSDKGDADVSLGVQNMAFAALLDHWHLDRPIVVGHDFGGAVALRTRLLNARRFAALVLVDAVAVRPWGSEFFRHVQKHEPAFAGVPPFMHEAMVRSYILTAAYRDMDPAVLERTIAPWLGEHGQSAFYRQIAQASQSHTDEVQSRYGEIDEPTLVLWGAADRWIPSERGEELASLLGNAELALIPAAGHLVIEERPDELIARIVPFLRRRTVGA